MSGATSARPARPLPPFTEEHEALRASIRRFVAGELRPHARAWEEARWFPNEVFVRLGELGYLGLKYPREYGGGGGDHLYDAVLAEDLSRCGSGGVAADIGAHVSIATPPIWRFGTEEQKRRFRTPAIRGERIAPSVSRSPGRARTWPASAPSLARWTAAISSTARRRSSRTACVRTSW